MPYSEKELEDWLCANVTTVFEDLTARVVGRQLRLPNGGVLDVLVTRPLHEAYYEVTVVELKVDTIDREAVAQVLTYMGYVAPLMDRISSGMPHTVGFEVHGLLAAPRITNDARSCLHAIGGIVTYSRLIPIIRSSPVRWPFIAVEVAQGDRTIEAISAHMMDRLTPTTKVHAHE